MDPQTTPPANDQPADNAPVDNSGLGDQPQVVVPTEPAADQGAPADVPAAPAPEEPSVTPVPEAPVAPEAPVEGGDQGLGGEETPPPANPL